MERIDKIVDYIIDSEAQDFMDYVADFNLPIKEVYMIEDYLDNEADMSEDLLYVLNKIDHVYAHALILKYTK